MDLLNRLRNYLKKEKEALPWGYGCNEGKLSEISTSAWNVLTSEEKLIISRRSPFKEVRKLKLIELRRQGLSQEVVRELSGMHISAIQRLRVKDRGKDE